VNSVAFGVGADDQMLLISSSKDGRASRRSHSAPRIEHVSMVLQPTREEKSSVAPQSGLRTVRFAVFCLLSSCLVITDG
jgi:hypothetical protein